MAITLLVTPRHLCCLLFALWWCAPGPASADQDASAPRSASTTALVVQSFGSLEHTSIGGDTVRIPATAPADAYSAGLQLTASRRHQDERHTHELRAGTALRGYQATGRLAVDNQWFEGAVSHRTTRRTTLTASQRVAFAPRYSPGTLSAASIDAGPAGGAAALANLTLASMAGVSTQLSRRSSAALDYRFDRVGFSATGSAVANHQATADLARTFGRHVSVRLQYGASLSETTTDRHRTLAPAQHAEVGLTYAPAGTRGTTMAFGVTPSRTARSARSNALMSVGGFFKIGYGFTAQTRGGLDYQRTMYYLPGYDQPVLADAVAARLDGRLHERLAGSLSAAFSRGIPSGEDRSSRITSASGSARVDARMFGSTSLYGEYRYDASTLSAGLPALPGIAPRSRRSTAGLGITINFSPGARARATRQER